MRTREEREGYCARFAGFADRMAEYCLEVRWASPYHSDGRSHSYVMDRSDCQAFVGHIGRFADLVDHADHHVHIDHPDVHICRLDLRQF